MSSSDAGKKDKKLHTKIIGIILNNNSGCAQSARAQRPSGLEFRLTDRVNADQIRGLDFRLSISGL